VVEASTASTGDDHDDEDTDNELLVNETSIRNRERRRRAVLTPPAPRRRLPPPVSAAAALQPASSASAPLLAPLHLLLPRYRARGNIVVAALSNHPAFFGRTDRIMDGSGACARMEAFLKGGRFRRALADQSATGNLGEANVNEMRRLLKLRYTTVENDHRFGGSLNTSLVIDHVLVPELAIVLVMHACGGEISEEQAVELLEQPVVGEAERRRLLAEARGGSRVQRAIERM
jgi:hypothetical protein